MRLAYSTNWSILRHSFEKIVQPEFPNPSLSRKEKAPSVMGSVHLMITAKVVVVQTDRAGTLPN